MNKLSYYAHVALLIITLIAVVGSAVQNQWMNMIVMLVIAAYAAVWLFDHQE